MLHLNQQLSIIASMRAVSVSMANKLQPPRSIASIEKVSAEMSVQPDVRGTRLTQFLAHGCFSFGGLGVVPCSGERGSAELDDPG